MYRNLKHDMVYHMYIYIYIYKHGLWRSKIKISDLKRTMFESFLWRSKIKVSDLQRPCLYIYIYIYIYTYDIPYHALDYDTLHVTHHM